MFKGTTLAKLLLLLCILLVLTACARGRDRSISTISLPTYAGKIAHASTLPVIDYPSTANQSAQVLSKFSTSFHKATKGRAHNINRAASLINGAVVMPEQVFSFNEAVGPTTKKNGYKLGKIFIKGKEDYGYGGGVCQVSSTLYNAVEKAGFEIVERHPHSAKVTYVPDDRDAATSYGQIDFKFLNNMPFPIQVISYTSGENVYVEVLQLI